MTIKKVFSLSGLFCILFSSTAFINPQTEVIEAKIDNTRTFANFLSYFEKIETPFQIGLDDLKDYDKSNLKNKISQKLNSKAFQTTQSVMSNYIPELRSKLISRQGPPQILPIARFYPNNNMIAVIYMPYYRFWSSGISEFKIVLFDLKGNNIKEHKKSKKLLAPKAFSLANNNSKITQTFSIDKGDKGAIIWKNTYKNVWKKDIQTYGQKDNEIIDYKLTATDAFKITAIGEIEQAPAYSIDSRASIN